LGWDKGTSTNQNIQILTTAPMLAALLYAAPNELIVAVVRIIIQGVRHGYFRFFILLIFQLNAGC